MLGAECQILIKVDVLQVTAFARKLRCASVMLISSKIVHVPLRLYVSVEKNEAVIYLVRGCHCRCVEVPFQRILQVIPEGFASLMVLVTAV